MAKVLVAGGFGVGKTTAVGAVSEIPPLVTEEILTVASAGVDDLDGTPDKTTTTVAMDFGRITLPGVAQLFLFGTPGQQRFWFMWDDLCRGAFGAIILVDTEKLESSFAALDYFDQRQLPYVVAVNCFNGHQQYSAEKIASHLAIEPGIPVLMFDAREREDVRRVLLTFWDHLIERAQPAIV